MEKEHLKEWYIKYRENRDIILKKIESIIDNKTHISIKNKDNSEEVAIIHEDITSIVELLKPFNKEKHIITVVLNKKAHIELLLKEWDKLIEYTYLTIIFVNPHSSEEKKWLIKPAVHNKITEKSALRSGIQSIAESVELY